MAYEFHQKVLFKHCDPAGIVFYPRYFEMMTGCVEHFFVEVLATPFKTLHAQGGVDWGPLGWLGLHNFSSDARHVRS